MMKSHRITTLAGVPNYTTLWIVGTSVLVILGPLIALVGCAPSDESESRNLSRWVDGLNEDYQNVIQYEFDGDFELAEELYSKMIAKAPSFAQLELYRGRAGARAGLGRHTDAISDYEQILEWRPSDADAWFCLASVYASMSDYDRAIECVDKAITLKTESCRSSVDLMRGQKKAYLLMARSQNVETNETEHK